MNLNHNLLEAEARHQVLAERVAQASAPRIHTTPHRHRMARGLRRFADRLDG